MHVHDGAELIKKRTTLKMLKKKRTTLKMRSSLSIVTPRRKGELSATMTF